MQSVSSRIWTRVAVSISYDDNHYTTGTSIFFFKNANWIIMTRIRQASLRHTMIFHTGDRTCDRIMHGRNSTTELVVHIVNNLYQNN